ncbi:MAG: phospholipase D-like domain-containing protein [Chloroflexia bacterium]
MTTTTRHGGGSSRVRRGCAVLFGLALLVAVVLIGYAAIRTLGSDEAAIGDEARATPTALAGKPARSAEANVVVSRFWVEPAAKYEAIVPQLRAAKTSLDVVVYLFSDPTIANELIAAHKRGVKVRVISRRTLRGGSGGKKIYNNLRRRASPKYGNPTFRYTHEKAVGLTADRARGYRQFTKSAFSRNRFIALVTTQAEVAEIQAIFNATGTARLQAKGRLLVVSDEQPGNATGLD